MPVSSQTRASAADIGDAFGMPEDANSAQQLQTAIGRLLRRQEKAAFAAIRENSGSALVVSDSWCLGQVHGRSRLGAAVSIGAIAERLRIPRQVLEPASAMRVRTAT